MDGKTPSILIAASGSGGHLMPAKLIAEALLEEGAAVSFVGSGKPLEEEIIGPLRVPRYEIPMDGVNNRGIFGGVKFFLSLPVGILKTRAVLRDSRADAIVGVGGYASVLPVLLGSWQGLPSWIHEAELSPGNANRLLARFADVISLAFEEAGGFPQSKTRFTGHPLRKDVAALAKRDLRSKVPRNVLVLGGSQGSRALDEGIFSLAAFFKERGIHLWHQCRPEAQSKLEDRYREAQVEATVMPFIQELGEAYSWSDIVVCRAGAGTVMEIGVVNRPAIFVPYPHAQGNHQQKNAETLTRSEKAVIVSEGERFSERLEGAITQLLDPGNYLECVQRVGPVRPLQAASEIASGILRLI